LLRDRGQGQLASQANPFFVHRAGRLGGTAPAPRSRAGTEFLVRVRLAITRPLQVISSRQVRTSAEGTCTVGVSPRYRGLASRSASFRSFLFFDRKINRSCTGCATRTREAIGRSRSW
jgi:hypothetical protein